MVLAVKVVEPEVLEGFPLSQRGSARDLSENLSMQPFPFCTGLTRV